MLRHAQIFKVCFLNRRLFPKDKPFVSCAINARRYTDIASGTHTDTGAGPSTLVMAENIFKWVFNYIHWTWNDRGDKCTFMFMLIRGETAGHKSKNLRNKMERVRQWMSPGILLIKTVPPTVRRGGGRQRQSVGRRKSERERERESIVKMKSNKTLTVKYRYERQDT